MKYLIIALILITLSSYAGELNDFTFSHLQKNNEKEKNEKIKNCDGEIRRGAFGNPYCFTEKSMYWLKESKYRFEIQKHQDKIFRNYTDKLLKIINENFKKGGKNSEIFARNQPIFDRIKLFNMGTKLFRKDFNLSFNYFKKNNKRKKWREYLNKHKTITLEEIKKYTEKCKKIKQQNNSKRCDLKKPFFGEL